MYTHAHCEDAPDCVEPANFIHPWYLTLPHLAYKPFAAGSSEFMFFFSLRSIISVVVMRYLCKFIDSHYYRFGLTIANCYWHIYSASLSSTLQYWTHSRSVFPFHSFVTSLSYYAPFRCATTTFLYLIRSTSLYTTLSFSLCSSFVLFAYARIIAFGPPQFQIK